MMHFRPGNTVFDRYPAIPRERRSSPRQIIERVAAWHDLTYRDILSRDQFGHFIAARFDAIAAVQHNYPKMSLLKLGAIFNGRDHTTILNALRKRGMR